MKNGLYNKPSWIGSLEGLVQKTITVPSDFETYVIEKDSDGLEHKVVKSGTYFTTPYKGLLFNDVDITAEGREASLVIRGSYIDANLPASVAASASDLSAQGLYAIDYDSVTRPDFGSIALTALTEPTGTAVAGAISWTKINGATKYEVYVANEAGDKVYVADAAQAASPTYTVEANGSYYLKAIGDNVHSVDSKFSTAVVVSGLEG